MPVRMVLSRYKGCRCGTQPNPQVTVEAQVDIGFLPYYPMCLFSCCSIEHSIITGLFH